MNMRECWNWQTGRLEVPVSHLQACGFKSHLSHQRRSKVRFAPTPFYAYGRKRRHPHAPLLLLLQIEPAALGFNLGFFLFRGFEVGGKAQICLEACEFGKMVVCFKVRKAGVSMCMEVYIAD